MKRGIESVQLDSLCDGITDCNHSTPSWLREGVFIIRNFNIKDRVLDISDAYYVDEETYAQRAKRAVPESGDIVISREAPMGEACLIPDNLKCCLGQRLVLLKPNKNKTHPHYLLNALYSHYVQQQIQRIDSTGSTVSNLNIPDLQGLLIPVTSLSEQIRIGNLFDTMARKLENNRVLVAKLSSFVQMLYNYWFVQFDFPNEEGKPYRASGGKMAYNEILQYEIPKGWKVGTLSSLGTIVGGGTPDTKTDKFYCAEGIAWITPKDLSDRRSNYISHGYRDITELGLSKSSAALMPEGTVLMSSRAPIGLVAIATNDVSTNQGFKSIIPFENYSSEYIAQVIKTQLPSIISKGGGTTFKEVSKDNLETFTVVIPSTETMRSYNVIAKSVGNYIRNTEAENQELISLRDWLLPLLMNGQVLIESTRGNNG